MSNTFTSLNSVIKFNYNMNRVKFGSERGSYYFLNPESICCDSCFLLFVAMIVNVQIELGIKAAADGLES